MDHSATLCPQFNVCSLYTANPGWFGHRGIGSCPEVRDTWGEPHLKVCGAAGYERSFLAWLWLLVPLPHGNKACHGAPEAKEVLVCIHWLTAVISLYCAPFAHSCPAALSTALAPHVRAVLASAPSASSKQETPSYVVHTAAAAGARGDLHPSLFLSLSVVCAVCPGLESQRLMPDMVSCQRPSLLGQPFSSSWPALSAAQVV